MAKQNRICHTCGKGYYYCPSCPNDKRDPQIYIMWCGDRCKQIFGLLSDETFKKITTAECKDELIKLGVTADEKFKDGVMTHAERVLSFTEPVIKEEVIIAEVNEVSETEEIDETNKTEEIDEVNKVEEIILEEPKTYDTTYVAKNKKKKRNSEVD